MYNENRNWDGNNYAIFLTSKDVGLQMDLGTIIGVIAGFIAVIGAMVLKDVSFSSFNNPAAFLVIFLGTFASVFIATPPAELKNFGSLLGVVFGKQRFMKRTDAVMKLEEFTQIARSQGVLALESKAADESDRFLARGIQLLVDGTENQKIEEYLYADIDAMEQRHAGYANIFSQAGAYAPTLGVLGAVLGLIAALGDLSDMDRLSHAISAAFIATVLGIFTGYVLWHPMANKLKRKTRMEVQVKTLIIQGICGIADGQNPRAIRENLCMYLTSKEKKIVVKE